MLTASQFDGYVVWMLPNGTCQDSKTADQIVLATAPNECRHKSGSCGPFNATNIDPGPGVSCLQSNLTVIMNSTPLLIQYGTEDVDSNITSVNRNEIMARGKKQEHFNVSHLMCSWILCIQLVLSLFCFAHGMHMKIIYFNYSLGQYLRKLPHR